MKSGVFGIGDIQSSKLTYFGLLTVSNTGDKRVQGTYTNQGTLRRYRTVCFQKSSTIKSEKLTGSSVIGHVRYGDSGGSVEHPTLAPLPLSRCAVWFDPYGDSMPTAQIELEKSEPSAWPLTQEILGPLDPSEPQPFLYGENQPPNTVKGGFAYLMLL